METIPVFTISSVEYLNYLLVMIWSAMLWADPQKQYVFYIAHQGIALEKQLWMQRQLACMENCRVCFLDVASAMAAKGWDIGNFTGKTPCFSLLAPDFLPQYDKLLVLDADLIVRRDIAELYHTELGDNFLGAVPDLDFIGQWARGNREYYQYYTQDVPLSDPLHYVQAGVLLLNCQALRRQFPAGFFYQIAEKQKFRYDDQDIWNLYCAGRIVQLEQRWNVIHDNRRYRLRHVIAFAPRALTEEYRAARENPYIVHYAGDQKPWNDSACDFAQVFWTVAQQTPIAGALETQCRIQSAARRSLRGVVRFVYHECMRAGIRLRLFLKRS